MASGRTHDIINLTALPVFVYYLKPEDFLAFSSGYLIGTFLLSPDNDLYHSKPNKRWKFLRFIWLPYVKIFSHRGVSHLPILGLVFKLFYLFLIFFIFYFFVQTFIFKESLNLNKEMIKEFLKSPFVLSFFIGLIIAEFMHIITDIIYSAIKKLRPKRRKYR